jgi:hypothetical protein
MDEVRVSTEETGTEVSLRRRLGPGRANGGPAPNGAA